MENNEKTLGSDHPVVAALLGILDGFHERQRRYGEAEPLYRRSLAILEKVLGPDRANVATSLNNLASVYGHQGRYTDAEPLYKQSLAIREKARGDRPDVAQS